MSSINGLPNICCPSYITPLVSGVGPPPLLNGQLSTQWNATFSSPTAPGLGMLNFVIFG